ncbi:hypothetical protein LCGC14_2232510 [marine sediment metagenome]|uniref:Uncharacterized protein n=1 Tax=marine sediment metagenome TaxID=412755 RepID=A0A0F9G2X3_9ZZZZ
MRGKRLVWTPEQDDYLVSTHGTLSAKAQARHLHRPYPSVIFRRHELAALGRIDPGKRAYQRPWTEEEEEYLTDHYSDRSMAALCRRLRRSVSGINNHKKRLGVRRTDGFYTARSLGEVFHVDPKVVAWWVKQGWLTGKKAPYNQGIYRPWVFHEEEVRELIQERPWLFKYARMERHIFRSLVLEQWERDPWYTIKDAARRFNVSDEYLRGVALRGDIQTFQRQPEKKWSKRYVRKSEMERWLATRSSIGRQRQSQARRRTLWQKGKPQKVAMTWQLRCPRCDQPFRVESPPRMRGPQVMKEFGDSHQCET